jgi:6-pyruvoyl-tetrahydropterin synthase
VNRYGMVIDFGDLDASIGAWFKSTYDHTTILHTEDPLARTDFGPRGVALVHLPPTCEVLAGVIANGIPQLLPHGLTACAVTVYESENGWARYAV